MRGGGLLTLAAGGSEVSGLAEALSSDRFTGVGVLTATLLATADTVEPLRARCTHQPTQTA